jgi:glycosyltransferase involved in cell wall biosynthesis
MKKGWLVNDTLTCIPNTKTFWHDLLEWIPNLEDKCNGNTPFHILPFNIELDAKQNGFPDYIIRNATYFRQINLPIKTISLLQDLSPNNYEQINVCNNSDVVVFNSPYTQAHYLDKITTKTVMIPLGVDFDKFKPLKTDYSLELGILPESILFIGAANDNPKGFDIMMEIINNTNYNFCLVMKDGFTIDNPRVKVFNRIDHDLLVKVINSCEQLVCTSRIETLHLAGVEAAACGLPLVTSNVGIYYNKPSGSWGRNTYSFDYKDFIREIEYVKNNKLDFNPREEFLDMGLSTESCKKSWLDLINTI